MVHAGDAELGGHGAVGWWPRYLAVAGLLLAAATQAAVPDLARAERLLQEGQADEAAALFEQALEADPSSVGAHLGLGRALYALGEYARARIEFESVLKFGNLPRDVQGQAEVYDKAAADYLAGRRWQPFYYAEAGIGNHRENASSSTDMFGGAGRNTTFLPLRAGGGLNAKVGEQHSFTVTLDYRFRWYDDRDRRDDSDLRWNVNFSRPLDDDNLRLGMRGERSYQGDSQYRNDWGVFGDYRLGLGDSDQLTIVGEVGERRYPTGPLASRTHDFAELTAGWTHSLPSGRTSFTLGGQLTQEWASQDHPDGDGSFWGVNGEVDHSFRDTLDGLFWWSYVNESYDDRRPDTSTDAGRLRARNDDLWNFGASLAWGFARGWSLRPTLEYNWEDSNIDELAYSSTEYWLTVLKSF